MAYLTRRKNPKLALMTAALTLSMLFTQSPVSAATRTYTNSTGGANAVCVSGTTKTLKNITVKKTGGSDSEEADFNGTNAAILAKNGAALTIKKAKITTSGKHANAVFSYGSGTTVKISNSTIKTSKDMSGGIMTTGGGTMIAKNLTVKTSGNSSAAIRSDRGGGTVKVSGGTYQTSGVGSPAIYSTADITVKNAKLKATKSEAVVIEGGNSVTLTGDTVIGNNSKLNGQSQVKTNVMIYQSMSGDASGGSSSFTMTKGKMTAKTGCMFYVTNTTTSINLNRVTFVNKSGTFLTVAAGPWGRSGSNGGNVTLNATKQTIKGKVTVDSSSSLAMNLKKSSTFRGSISGSGTVNVTIDSGSTWKLTGNSSVKSLSASASSIDLNGYTLTVGGKTWKG